MARNRWVLVVLLALAAVARGQGAGCDTDAVQCPDGSFVQRNPALQCNFDPCPQHACPTDARQCPDGTIVGRDIHNHCHWHDCPTDDESPSGAAGPLFARLNATKTFSVGNINNVSAMDVDEHFVYVATHDIIIKASKDNVDDFGVLSLDARSHLGQLSDFTAVRTLRVDATHIYTTAQKAGGHWLLKIDKDLMELISSVPFGAEDGAAKALALDASYVYTGMETNPGRVLKWRKDSLALAARLELLAADLEAGETAGEDNVQALVRDASDAAHLYALCGAMPGRVVQILTDNTAPAEAQMETGLRRVRALVLSEDTPMAGIIDSGTGHLYLGTAGSTARVLKVLAHSMARAGEVELTHANGTSAPMPGDVAAMQQDNDYLYVGMTSYPGTVVRVHKAPMSVRDEVRLAPGEDNVAAMTHADGTLFVGTGTSPAKLVQVSGYLEPLDCKLSAWTSWSACSSTCQGGSQHRQRIMLGPARYGGISCDTLGMPAHEQPTQSETRSCNQAIVCPVPCHGGMVWVAGSGTAPQRTCGDRSTPASQTGLSHCECPPGRPYLHQDGFCATPAVCDKQLLHKCPEEDLTCSVTMEDGGSTGRIVVQRRSARTIQDYHCRHHPNSVESCRCLCRIMVNGTQVNTAAAGGGDVVSASAAAT